MHRRQLIASALLLPWIEVRAADAPRWYFIFLETGRPTPDDKAAVQKMQQGHLDNFVRLHAEGRLFAAGPLRDPARIKRGIVVAKAASRDELQHYFDPDEYVREGYMTVNAVPAKACSQHSHQRACFQRSSTGIKSPNHAL